MGHPERNKKIIYKVLTEEQMKKYDKYKLIHN
jgi:hypothetical protein